MNREKKFAKDYPILFYDAFMEFFRTGEGNVNQYRLSPDKSLYEMNPVATNENYPKDWKSEMMELADWIVLVGIRSSSNKSYEGKDSEQWDAISRVSFMKKMARQFYEIDDMAVKIRVLPSIFRGKGFNKKVRKSFILLAATF